MLEIKDNSIINLNIYIPKQKLALVSAKTLISSIQWSNMYKKDNKLEEMSNAINFHWFMIHFLALHVY